jgi:hypothetical protein
MSKLLTLHKKRFDDIIENERDQKKGRETGKSNIQTYGTSMKFSKLEWKVTLLAKKQNVKDKEKLRLICLLSLTGYALVLT